MMNQPVWIFKKFEELKVAELYSILQLRSQVFVVEQNCVYLDADGRDAESGHLCGWLHNQLVAYCRILPPGLAYDQASIGRVLTNLAHRKDGYGKKLMQKAIEITYSLYNVPHITIGAQQYLLQFYKELGFKPIDEPYLEDGIPHIHMIHNR
jgi:ElaA protein